MTGMFSGPQNPFQQKVPPFPPPKEQAERLRGPWLCPGTLQLPKSWETFLETALQWRFSSKGTLPSCGPELPCHQESLCQGLLYLLPLAFYGGAFRKGGIGGPIVPVPLRSAYAR